MPYIITTKTPYEHSTSDGALHSGFTYSRRAVAALDEAREIAFAQMAECERYALSDAARISDSIHTLPEHGGTVGPLPDGTVIEVEQVDWIDFERLAREAAGTTGDLPPIETFDNDRYRAEIIDAYNAQEH